LRLLEVRGLFDALGSQLCDTLVPLATLAFLLPAAVRGMGVAPPLILVVHCLLLRICHLLGPDLEALHGRAAALEGCFQALHGRLRASSEAVAASSGGLVERHLMEPRFKALLAHLSGLRRCELAPRAFSTFFFDYRQLPACTHRLVSLFFTRRSGLSDCGAATSADAACVSFLFDRLMQAPQIAVQHLARSAESAAHADGQCRRYLELLVACELASKVQAPPLSVSIDGRGVRVWGLDLVAPRGEVLARGLEFEVEAGVPLLVTGPSAGGKSLLAGALAGLWGGQPRPPLRTMMACPQQPYLPACCRLLAQLAYPSVLRLPSRPPFQAYAAGLPDGVSEDDLREHFLRVGGEASQATTHDRHGECAFVVTFQTFDALLRALSKPQDRVIKGRQLDLEFVGAPSANGSSSLGGNGAPRLGRARRSLADVGLEHVLTREQDGWFARRAWEEVLSGSEQQLLCLARLLFHGPVFAVLDDCTATLEEASERRFHETLLQEWGVTPIMMTRHAFFPELYAREFRLRAPSCPDGRELRSASGAFPPAAAQDAADASDEASLG